MIRTKPPPSKARKYVSAAERVRADCRIEWLENKNDPEKFKESTDKLKDGDEANDFRIHLDRVSLGSWLNQNIPFDYGLKLSAKDREIAIKFLFELLNDGKRHYKLDEKVEDFCILIANLLKEKNKIVAIHQNRNRFKKSRSLGGRSRNFILDALKMLEQGKHILMQKGHNIPPAPRISRIWPSESLLNRFYPVGKIENRPIELINLLDEDGNDILFNETAKITRMRNILKQANIINRRHEVQLLEDGQALTLETDLHAVFTRKLSLHGRLYTNYHGYQKFSKKERSQIRIDRQPVAELDFSGIHPRLLYAKAGEQYDGDPYLEVTDDEELRPILKILLLRLINAKTFADATWHGADDWSHKKSPENSLLLRRKGITIKRLAELFKKAHAPIAKYFDTKNIGLKLMRKDSEIALEVIKYFTSKNIPILSIHDSFIVQEQYEEELMKAMQDSYGKITGGFFCKIK